MTALVLTTTGCIAYQDRAAPTFPTNLPAPAPLWSVCQVNGPHAQAAAAVVSASSTCGPGAPTRLERTVVLTIEERVTSNDVCDFFAGFTLTTFPALRWHELHVRGDLLQEEQVIATVEARSSYGVAAGWPLVVAFPFWSDLSGTELAQLNVRALTRNVVSDLVRRDGELPRPKPAEPVGEVTGGTEAGGEPPSAVLPPRGP